MIYTLPDGRVLSEGTPFELEGVRYPRNWLARATPEDLAERNIVASEPPEPEPEEPTPPTTEQLLEHLANLRWEAENAGTTWGDIPLPTDRERRSALKDAADKMRDGTLTSPIAVAFSTTVYASVTLEQLDAAVQVITLYVQKVFADAMAVSAQIIDGTLTTYEDVDATWANVRSAS